MSRVAIMRSSSGGGGSIGLETRLLCDELTMESYCSDGRCRQLLCSLSGILVVKSIMLGVNTCLCCEVELHWQQCK